ncbi:PorT family protein [Solitalea koreensis]|uniref:Outer membrane protein beta-barrel domain-containing protein n=1 Tax=Solitalea koreensis TaxID=543615 RepID=A0A521CBJ7_9SPHI|nr:PorT family protein [Solitalea koreensis]SMO56140.1 hypothetical protein SAMN06265350_103328 [Solitalea koreensis]
MGVNKNIDKIFREGLRESENNTVFNENEWDLLEKRLDKAENNKRIFFWLKTASGIAAILVLGFVLWQLPLGKQSAESIPGSNKDITQNKKVIKEHNQSGDQLVKSLDTKTKAVTEPVQKPPKEGLLTFNENPSFSFDSTNANVAIMVPNESKKELFADQRSPSLIVDSGRLSSIVKNKDDRYAFEHKNKRPVTDRLVLSFSVAPALNGVNNFKNPDLGGDIGMLLTYKMSEKWSLTSGAIYAKMLYSTGFENYNPNSQYRFKYAPSNVNADCRALDIPLNINYTVFNKKNNKIGLTAGLSSYLMLKENYNFVYDYPNPSYPQSYEIRNKNQHWLGVVNLQASYERKINSNVGIGIQPFVKIPIENIGYSQVKLKTVGVAVNLNFNLGPSKSKKK